MTSYLDSGNADDFRGRCHHSRGQLFLQYLENQFARDAYHPLVDAGIASVPGLE